MKNRLSFAAYVLAAGLMMGTTAFAGDVVEESTEVSTEAVIETFETEKAEDFVITLEDGTELTVENRSGMEISAAVEAGEDDMSTVTLSAEDGSEHLFEKVNFADMSNLAVNYADTFLFIRYSNAAGERKTAYETAEEVTLEEAETYYVLSDVYVRAEANPDAQPVAIATLGSSVTVTAAMPKWCKAQLEDGTEGYISRPYLSVFEADAEAAVKAEESARAAQAAAAAAAAAAAQNQQGGGQKYEVSREQFLDCDGSGHGYAIVHYSDGSQGTVNF